MFEKIIQPIQAELEQLEAKFQSVIDTDIDLIKQIFNYIITSKGKRLRPILLLLCSGLKSKPTTKSIDAAIIIELLHTATLIHDDVVDNSNLRRGNPSINSIWENKISVLIGDFLFAHIFNSLVDFKDPKLIKIISKVTTKMSQGELLQMEKAQDFEIDEATYFRLISYKTASLLAATCQLGAYTSDGEDYTHEENLRIFGESLGIAFQIKDDLLDYYGSEDKLGKPIGKDLIENIITLPVLYSLRQVNRQQQQKIISLLQNGADNQAETIVPFLKDTGGIQYAEHKADHYIQNAMQRLDVYPDSPYKQSLILLAEYITSRNK
ncbi:MAG TPA: polyprenyl synthetase family protein [bacterium]|nr:polyprenyl synthetase family protein [bacterium]